MRRWQALFSFALILFGSTSYANGCGSWQIEGEYLYLLPSIDDTYFVLRAPQSQSFPNGTRENGDFDFHSGFRVGAGYTFCDCSRSLDVKYTRLCARERETVAGQFLWATVGDATFVTQFQNYSGSALSDLDLAYHRVDGFLTQQIWDCRCFECSALLGVEYAYFRLDENHQYRTAALVGAVDQRSKIWGVGPQFGLGFDYQLFCFSGCFCPGTFSITGQATGSLLSSRSSEDAFHQLSTGDVTLNVQSESTWRIVPVGHALVGVRYATCFSCFGLALEVGYEFNVYIRELTRMINPDPTADSLTFTDYYNFGLQGLYVSVAAFF